MSFEREHQQEFLIASLFFLLFHHRAGLREGLQRIPKEKQRQHKNISVNLLFIFVLSHFFHLRTFTRRTDSPWRGARNTPGGKKNIEGIGKELKVEVAEGLQMHTHFVYMLCEIYSVKNIFLCIVCAAAACGRCCWSPFTVLLWLEPPCAHRQ